MKRLLRLLITACCILALTLTASAAAVKAETEALGHPFVCDSGEDFSMGEADGHFTYVEDPDGTLIEFVETFKVPIIKKLGIAINLRGRAADKPLRILKLLRLMKIKHDRIK